MTRFDSRWVEIFRKDRPTGQEAKAVKKFRYGLNTHVIYMGKTYRPGDTIDLSQEEFHAFPQPHMLDYIGDAESLDAKRTKVDENLTVVHGEFCRDGVPFERNAQGALAFAAALCRAAGIEVPRRSPRTAHFDEGLSATPVDPASVAFSEAVEQRVEKMRSWGRKEPDHILMREAAQQLRSRGVASSSW